MSLRAGAKRLLSVLLLLSLFSAALSAPGQADAPSFSSQEELVAYLSANRNLPQAELRFFCTRELFESLRADDFALFWTVTARAGIESCSMSYNDTLLRFTVSAVVPTKLPWADCAGEADVSAAIRLFTESGYSGFTLICPIALKEELYRNDLIAFEMARGGVLDNCDISFFSYGAIRVRGITYTSQPYAVVDDPLEFRAAVDRFRKASLDSFNILFSKELFDSFVSDGREWASLRYSSSLDQYRGTYYSSVCRVAFQDVTYTDLPRILCESEEEIVETIRQMGTAGVRDFSLVVLDRSLFGSLCADSFARLRALESQGGMWSRKLSYSDEFFLYGGAQIEADAPSLSAFAEAVDFVSARVEAGSRTIPLFCSAELYSGLLNDPGNGLVRIWDLTESAGIARATQSYTDAAHLITLKDIRLFPGRAVVLAERSGDFSELSPRERELRNEAVRLAAALRTTDPYETALRIHDWLCAQVTYTVDPSTDEDDSAIGAILSGRANCDGYSDAFYLLGTLAGLKVRYQHGAVYDDEPGATHLWNLLELDGSWQIVDVTWDDGEEDVPPVFHWFAIGTDRASRTHFWNEDMYGPLLARTDPHSRPASEFTAYSFDDLDSAAEAARSAGLRSFSIFLEDDALVRQLDAVKAHLAAYMREALWSFWDSRMRALTVFDADFS